MNDTSQTERQILVWDLPTRVFHWVLAALVVTSVITGLDGGYNAMRIHMGSGAAILTLVIYRVIWGVVGGRHARFTDFVKGPVTAFQYARGLITRSAPRTLGHNPLGGWSVVVLLCLLSYQAYTGLYANDDIYTEGPWYSLVDKETSDAFTARHHFNIMLLYVMVGLHVAAIGVHALLGENLLTPMMSGRKPAERHTDTRRDKPTPKGHPLLALAILTVVGTGVYYALFIWPGA